MIDAITETCPDLMDQISVGIMPLECYIESLYTRTVQNFGFNGDPNGLPVEVCWRLFELYIFFEDKYFAHFTALVIHCLQMRM